MNKHSPCSRENYENLIPRVGVKFYDSFAHHIDCKCCVFYRGILIGGIVGFVVGAIIT